MSELLEGLQGIEGLVLRRGDPRYPEEIRGYNGIVEHLPELVVGARSAQDIVAAVRYAGQNGYSVGVMASGHGISQPAHGVLVTTSRMDRVLIDPEHRTATVQAGVRSSALLAAAARHGLAPLNGSSPGAGVVGYTAGGGVPMLGRLYGYAADRVRSLQLVTADGQLRRLERGAGDELFWAVLGGKDNFGIVAEIEIDLLPISTVNGGGLWFTDAAVPDAVRSYVVWAGGQPRNLSSSLLLMRLPDLDVIPEPIRGRFIAHVRLLHVGPAEEAAKLVAPLRAAAPVTQDTFGEMAYGDVGSIHNDPDGPVVFEAANSLLSELDEAGVEALLGQAGPAANPGYLVELRQLGGRLAERPEQAVVGRQDGHWVLYSGTPLYGGSRDEAAADQARLHEAMTPWGVGGSATASCPGPGCRRAATSPGSRAVTWPGSAGSRPASTRTTCSG